jgi:hypothetical protein
MSAEFLIANFLRVAAEDLDSMTSPRSRIAFLTRIR